MASPVLPDDDPSFFASEPTLRGRTSPRGERLRAGDVLLGRYTVLSELGEGGMGVVYRCLDSIGGIEVALKCLPPELSRNEAELEGIRENYAIVSRLHHSYISGLRNLEKDPDFGEYFLVMDLAEGEDLSVLLRRRHGAPMPPAEALAILRPLASALDYAHGEKVLHRDVKPANVKVSFAGDGAGRPGGPPRVQLLDFGLAAEVRSSLSRVSRRGHLGASGTPSYMAPEQWEARPQRPATDQYALAVVAYQMLSGHLPFEADDPDVLRRAVLSRAPDPIPGLSRRANAAILRALAKDPAARFPSCTAFLDALAAGARPRSGRFPWIAVVLGLVVLGFLGALRFKRAYEARKSDSTVREAEVPPLAPAGEESRAPAEEESHEAAEEEPHAPAEEESHEAEEEPGAMAEEESYAPEEEPREAEEEVDAPAEEEPHEAAEEESHEAEEEPVAPAEEVSSESAEEPGEVAEEEPVVPAEEEFPESAEEPVAPAEEESPESEEGPVAPAEEESHEVAEEPVAPAEEESHETEEEPRAPGEPKIVSVNGVGITLRWCPPGSFRMGSSPDRKSELDAYEDEWPQVDVTIRDGFWMGETEVTQAQWEAVMGKNPSYFLEGFWRNRTSSNRPVERVSWNDCTNFVARLNRLPETKASGVRFAMPTEAQWEYACRATGEGKFGNVEGGREGALKDMGWYNPDGDDHVSDKDERRGPSGTFEVGRKKPNAWGLRDMHGNVWEWCANVWRVEPTDGEGFPDGSLDNDGAIRASGESRVLRGGGYRSKARDCRSAVRFEYAPDEQDWDVGFRLCAFEAR